MKARAESRLRDFFYARKREGGVYLQDMNTDSMLLYFEPGLRTLTMISRGADARRLRACCCGSGFAETLDRSQSAPKQLTLRLEPNARLGHPF